MVVGTSLIVMPHMETFLIYIIVKTVSVKTYFMVIDNKSQNRENVRLVQNVGLGNTTTDDTRCLYCKGL